MSAVDKLFAYVTEGEGLMAVLLPQLGGWLPMVGANEENMRNLYPFAVQSSKESGKPFKVLLFESPKDVTARFTGTDN